MRIGELVERAGVTTKAVRYYESLGLITPERRPNGYREYGEFHVRAVSEVRRLAECGIAPSCAAPFIECLDAGHVHGDECPASLAAYRDSISELDRTIALLTARRALLADRLQDGAERSFNSLETSAMTDYSVLPEGLPVPTDDGGAAHLPGLAVPALTLPSTDGQQINLAELGPGRSIVYLYPLTGRPGVDLPAGWDQIPGARGCSTEACDFRDHFKELAGAGVSRVFGLSSQETDYQREVVERLKLPFPMLSDEKFALQEALDLPVFSAPGHGKLYARLTLVVLDGLIEHAFYPIFPPNEHAQQVLKWLAANPR
ncbi:redoxin family protein [Arthrobacter sp. USHLN218]|uniref:redoxin family protein n=1 Tax=Arthrobacter sp. USHLN218 TaxID=3081232 RepID=UPI003019AE2C